MVKCDKTNRRKTLDEFALEAEGNEEEASLSLFDLLCIGIGGTVGSGVFVRVRAVDIDASFAFARQIRRVLLDTGADINVRSDNSQTPLINAVGFIGWDASRPNRHRVALVSDLLRAGASLDSGIDISEANPPMAGLSGRFDSVDDLLRAIEREVDGLRDNRDCSNC